MADIVFSLFLHTGRCAVARVVFMHDRNYKRLFSFRRMVEDLLRAVCDAELVEGLDFQRLTKLPTDYVGERGQERLGDCVWRVPFHDGWIYLLVLLEFQSRKDAAMALRNLEYTALLYTELGRTGHLGAPGDWPPVLPLVLYNGDTPWTEDVEMRRLIAPTLPVLEPFQPSQRSLVLDERRIAVDDLPVGNLMRAVAGLEQSRTPEELGQSTVELGDWPGAPIGRELGRAFVAWIQEMANLVESGEPLELGETLEEASMALVDRVAEWPEMYRREGGTEALRRVICRMAERRFGVGTTSRLANLLASIGDADRLEEVTLWVMDCRTVDELIGRVSRGEGFGN